MPRQPGVFYDKRAGCWATNALGEERRTKTGRAYRARTYWRDLIHPTKDRRRADDRLSESLRAEVANLRPVGEISMDQVSEYYLEVAERELGPETYARRREQLNRVLDWPSPTHPQRIAALRARDLTREDVRPMFEAFVAAGLSPSYVTKGLLMALKRMMSWAATVPPGRLPGLPLPTNRLAGMAGPAVLRRTARPVEAGHVTALIRHLWRRARRLDGLSQRFSRSTAILLWTLHLTGARPKELCAAEWSELKPVGDGWMMIVLPPWKHKTGRKTGLERKIAIPPSAAKRIEWLRSLDGRHDRFIFTHRRGRGRGGVGAAEAGEPWVKVDDAARRVGDTKTLQKHVWRLIAQARTAGVDLPEGLRMYWFRSRYATDARRSGANPTLLADAMGTSERMLDQNYTDLGETDILAVARQVATRKPVDGPSGPPVVD